MTTTIDLTGDADVRPAGEGPCTEAEARALLQRAADSATEFLSCMQEILHRRAWEALGYSEPRDMFREEFKNGTLINSQSGKSYSRAHVYRFASFATFVQQVNDLTGIDVADLDITEKALRTAHKNGVKDAAMLDQIEQKVSEASDTAPADPATVKRIVEEVIDEAAGRATPTSPDQPDSPRTPEGLQPAPPAVTADAVTPHTTDAGIRGGTDTGDWPNADPHPERKPPATDRSADPADPFSAFGNQTPGSMAPVGGMGWEDAVAAAQEFTDFNRTLVTIKQIGDQLPQIAEVRAKLPEFLDSCDDSELALFDAELAGVDALVAAIPEIRAAVQEIRSCIEDRANE